MKKKIRILGHKLSFRSYFTKILLILFASVLLPMIILGCVYRFMMADNVYDNFLSEQTLKINEMTNSVESTLVTIEDDLVALALYGPEKDSLVIPYSEIISGIADSLSTLSRDYGRIVSSAYYLNTFGNSVISSGHGYGLMSDFPDTAWYFALDYRPVLRRLPVRSDINSTLLTDPYYMSNHQAHDVITVVYGSIYSNVYVVNVSVEELNDSIAEGFMFASDTDSVTITGVPSAEIAESEVGPVFTSNEDRICATGTMYHGLLSYTIEYNRSEVMETLRYYMRYFFILTVTLAVVLLFLAWHAARRLYAPLGSLYSTVSRFSSSVADHLLINAGSDELAILKDTFIKMNNDRERSESTLRVYRAAAGAASLTMFLEQNTDVANFLSLNEELGQTDLYSLVLVNPLNKDKGFSSNLIELLEAYFVSGEKAIIAPLAKGRIGVLLGGEDEDAITRETDRLKAALDTLLEGAYHASGAKDCCGLDEIPSVYSRCLELINRAEFLDIRGNILTTFTDENEADYCERARLFLETNYTTDFDIASVADELSVSYPYLSKIFKAEYGTTLSDYLNSYRIAKSCELLDYTKDTLETIAAAVGYNNSQSYQRFFKKYKGMTPTEYRKKGAGTNHEA